jgi:hypothetical protein
MKKFIVILLLALFTTGITSCAVENIDTDPTVDEALIDDQTSETEEEEEGSYDPVGEGL